MRVPNGNALPNRERFIWICLAGAAVTGARYLVALWAAHSHVERQLPILDEMVTGGALVTVERVRVVKYAAGKKRSTEDHRRSRDEE
jgi:hypothetical protein